MSIPFEPVIFGIKVNIHLILEYAAFFFAFVYYRKLRRIENDSISNGNRLTIILGATIGALIGSRLVGYFENPMVVDSMGKVIEVLNTKSIMGGLFGGLLGVEIAKKIIKEKLSSGDLFTFPIILGIIIGRIGCFLTGIKEFTYGRVTELSFGMDLGDGLSRHPLALYEIIFLGFLFLVLKKLSPKLKGENGLLFILFMLSYFSFRFLVEFLKPNIYFTFGLSTIQWLCILCWLYYFKTILKIFKHAH